MVHPALPRREEWRLSVPAGARLTTKLHPALPRREDVPAGHPGNFTRIDVVPGTAAA
jgi:hypothetical protein